MNTKFDISIVFVQDKLYLYYINIEIIKKLEKISNRYCVNIFWSPYK